MFIIELQEHNSRTDVFMFDRNNSIRAMWCHIDIMLYMDIPDKIFPCNHIFLQKTPAIFITVIPCIMVWNGNKVLYDDYGISFKHHKKLSDSFWHFFLQLFI